MVENLIEVAGGCSIGRLLSPLTTLVLDARRLLRLPVIEADVVTTYLPSEEVEAKEVVELVRAAERKAYAIHGDLINEHSARANTTSSEENGRLGHFGWLLANNTRSKRSQISRPSSSKTHTK
jgi:hypothetical protein